MPTEATQGTVTPSSTAAKVPEGTSSFLGTIEPLLHYSEECPSTPSRWKGHDRIVITPGLWVATGFEPPDGVVLVPTIAAAAAVLRERGLAECCIQDRISVGRGGPVLCSH